jgi:hypothetical protein
VLAPVAQWVEVMGRVVAIVVAVAVALLQRQLVFRKDRMTIVNLQVRQ